MSEACGSGHVNSMVQAVTERPSITLQEGLSLSLKVPKLNKVEFANIIDPDEVTHVGVKMSIHTMVILSVSHIRQFVMSLRHW